MKCTNCGQELPAGTVFCPNCGSKIAENQEQAGNMESEAEARPNKIEVPKTSFTGLLKALPKPLLAIPIALVLLIIVLIVRLGGKTVDLSDYVTVSFSGYDTLGKAEYTFDSEAFEDDYGKKIKIKDKDAAEFASYFDSPAQIMSMVITFEFDKSDELSNGDEVILTCTTPVDEVEEAFNYSIKFKDTTYTVSGLEEVSTFDPFEGLTLTYSGIAPSGSATVELDGSNPIRDSYYFNVEPSSNLSNGDTVTVSFARNLSDEVMIEQYGGIPSAMEQEYTVEGLSSYITSTSQISDDLMEKMKAQAEDVFQAEFAKEDERESVEEAAYIGNYFLTKKDSSASYWGGISDIYLVYRITVRYYDEEAGVDDVFTYYRATGFDDMMLLADGSCSVDLADYSVKGSRLHKIYDDSRGWGVWVYYTGYEKLDTMFNQLVAEHVDQYTYEDNVEDVAEESSEEEASEEETSEEEASEEE